MDADKIYREALQKFLEEKERREHATAAQRQAAEIAFLSGAKDMAEYAERRETLRKKVMQPDISLDEMSMSDYMKVRAKQQK